MTTRIEILKERIDKIEDKEQLEEVIILFRSLLSASWRAISDLEDLNRIYPDAYVKELDTEIQRANRHEETLDVLGARKIELENP